MEECDQKYFDKYGLYYEPVLKLCPPSNKLKLLNTMTSIDKYKIIALSITPNYDNNQNSVNDEVYNFEIYRI